MRYIWRLGVIVALVVFPNCSDDQALTQRQFCELVRDRAEAEYPGILISRLDERGFDYARGTGQQGRLVVSEEYAYYTRNPGSLDDLVDRLVSLLGTRERLEHLQKNQDQLRRSILPVLKPPSFQAEAMERAGGQQLLFGEHSAGLLVFYVIDEPTSISYLTTGSLSGLGMSFRQVTDLALTNLARRTEDDRFVVERTQLGPIAVGDTRDGYDAARLISPLLLLTLSRLLDTSAAVVAIPRRDMLIAVPAGNPDLRAELSLRAQREFEAGPYAISPTLYMVDREGVRAIEEQPATEADEAGLTAP